jgi:triosephosphate isomerase (TIM)
MRNPFILANWKMYKTPSETEELLSEILPPLRATTGVDVAIAPSFTSLPKAAGMLAGTGVSLSAQDCHWEEEGPFTGQVSARMLVELGCRYVLLGHSECRQSGGDSDQRVNMKARSAMFWGLSPIICVGEKKDERDSGHAEMVVEAQLNRCLDSLHVNKGQRLLIAYEPIWAIGTGHMPTPSEVSSVHHIIRRTLLHVFGESLGSTMPILYGGSVTTTTVGPMLALDVVDGVLVGGASLRAESFLPLVEQVRAAGPQAA